MRKNVFGKKLKRDKNERTALFKNLMSSLILHERIETTQAKAKAIKPQVEKLVTKALKGGNASMKVVYSYLSSVAAEKLVKDIAPRFFKRQGGYTRIINLGNRFGDQAPMVVLEWVEKAKAVAVLEKPKENKASAKQNSKDKKLSKAPNRLVQGKATRLQTPKRSDGGQESASGGSVKKITKSKPVKKSK